MRNSLRYLLQAEPPYYGVAAGGIFLPCSSTSASSSASLPFSLSPQTGIGLRSSRSRSISHTGAGLAGCVTGTNWRTTGALRLGTAWISRF